MKRSVVGLAVLLAGIFPTLALRSPTAALASNISSLQARNVRPVAISDDSLVSQLMTAEQRLWDAWKGGKPEVWKQNLRDDAVFFGQYGVADKAELVNEQIQSVKSCKVESVSLTDPRAIRLDDHSAILLYEAEQHAVCNGVAVQPRMHGSSVYALREGEWLNVFRSEVPPAN